MLRFWIEQTEIILIGGLTVSLILIACGAFGALSAWRSFRRWHAVRRQATSQRLRNHRFHEGT